jgi:hypothetical protein
MEGVTIERVHSAGKLMSYQRKIHQGQNGESWWLCRNEGGGVFILHESSERSGGRTTRIEIGDFLSTGHPGPEHRSLFRLIGGLAKMTAADLS